MNRRVDDASESLDVVAETIASLQRIIEGGQSPDTVGFPDDLHLSVASADKIAGDETEAVPPITLSPGEPTPPVTADPLESSACGGATELTGDLELLAEFITEAQEHLDSVDAQLLTIDNNPDDTEALNCVFRSFHTIKGVAGFLDLGEVQRLAHETETMLDVARSGSLKLVGDALELTFVANDALKRMVADVEQSLGTGKQLSSDPTLPALLRRLRAAVSGSEDAATTGSPAEPVQPATASREQTDRTPPAQTATDKPQVKGSVLVRETIKVDADRLNDLVEAIGELVIAEAMVSQSDEWDLDSGTRLPGLLTHMDKITRELQQMAMSMRMVPIRSTFQRMARLARDVAKKVDKSVQFSLSGEDTELDKTVVDAIGDPLVNHRRNGDPRRPAALRHPDPVDRPNDPTNRAEPVARVRSRRHVECGRSPTAAVPLGPVVQDPRGYARGNPGLSGKRRARPTTVCAPGR